MSLKHFLLTVACLQCQFVIVSKWFPVLCLINVSILKSLSLLLVVHTWLSTSPLTLLLQLCVLCSIRQVTATVYSLFGSYLKAWWRIAEQRVKSDRLCCHSSMPCFQKLKRVREIIVHAATLPEVRMHCVVCAVLHIYIHFYVYMQTFKFHKFFGYCCLSSE